MMLPPLILALLLAALLLSAHAQQQRPNFIVMQPDDMQFFEEWLPPAHIKGREVYEGLPLPNIERLRSGGLHMTRAYTASSMCGTSRYSTMTGRYPSRSSESRSANAGEEVSRVNIPTTKLNDVYEVPDGMDCSQNNVAALLQSHGYTTGMFGKWHLYNTNTNDYEYTAVQEEIRACGFDVAEAVYWQNLNDNWTNGGRFTHNMEHMTDRALRFISQAVLQEEEPFFVYFNPTAPHAAGNVHEALLQHSCREAPEGTLEEEPVVPGMTLGMGCSEYRQTILDKSPDTSNANLGAIWVDDAVGALLQHLEALEILNNTLFLFQLDHGQEGKSTLYEPGVRIPQFVHYPAQIAPGSTFDGIVSTIDIAPTLADYAGIVDPYDMDGWSWNSRISSSSPRDDGCVLVELQYDRAVICSCQKYLVIGDPSDSNTFRRGNRWGLENDSPASLNLCNEDGIYLVTPESSPETNSAIGDFARLKQTLDCHLESTNPSNEPLYGMCDALVIGPTSAPLPNSNVVEGLLDGEDDGMNATAGNATVFNETLQLGNVTYTPAPTPEDSLASTTEMSVSITRTEPDEHNKEPSVEVEEVDEIDEEVGGFTASGGTSRIGAIICNSLVFQVCILIYLAN